MRSSFALETWQYGQHTNDQRGDGAPVHSVRVRIDAVRVVERRERQPLLAQNPIVGDENSAERPHQAAVTNEPGEYVRRGATVEFPGHHHDANEGGDQAAGHEADFSRIQMREIVGRAHHIRGHVRVKLRGHHN